MRNWAKSVLSFFPRLGAQFLFFQARMLSSLVFYSLRHAWNSRFAPLVAFIRLNLSHHQSWPTCFFALFQSSDERRKLSINPFKSKSLVDINLPPSPHFSPAIDNQVCFRIWSTFSDSTIGTKALSFAYGFSQSGWRIWAKKLLHSVSLSQKESCLTVSGWRVSTWHDRWMWRGSCTWSILAARFPSHPSSHCY